MKEKIIEKTNTYNILSISTSNNEKTRKQQKTSHVCIFCSNNLKKKKNNQKMVDVGYAEIDLFEYLLAL